MTSPAPATRRWILPATLLALGMGLGAGFIAILPPRDNDSASPVDAVSKNPSTIRTATTIDDPMIDPRPKSAGSEKGTLLERLRARTAKLTPEQRRQERDRMWAEDLATKDVVKIYDPERFLYYMALIQPEDLPELRSKLEEWTRLEESKDNETLDRERNSRFHSAILASWAETDLAGMEQWIIQAPNELSTLRGSAYTQLAITVARSDPENAWLRLRHIREAAGPGADLTAWENELISSLARRNALGLFQQVKNVVKDEEERTNLMRGILGTHAQRDFQGAMRLMREVEDQKAVHDIEAYIVRGAWNGPSPQYAVIGDYILAEAGDRARRMLGHYIREWKKRDPEACGAWIVEQGDELSEFDLRYHRAPPDRSTELDGLRPEEQVPTILSWEPNEANDVLLQTAFGTWIARDPEAALGALARVPEDRRGSAARDTALAVSAYDERLALRALAHVTEEKDRARVVETLTGSWFDYAPREASRWLNEQPMGMAKDAGVRTLLGKLEGQDPVATVHWAQQFSGEDERLKQTARALRAWEKTDKAATYRWVADQTFTPEAWAKLKENLTEASTD